MRSKTISKSKLPVQLSDEALQGLERIANNYAGSRAGVAAMVLEETGKTDPDSFAQVLAAISKFRAK
jgi:hypothetical protein